ncbi:MAG: GNAT family N-acetyltransferase [Acidobacteriota bacterium]
MKVEEVREVSEELVEAFARLTPQLSRSSPPPGEQELERIVQSDATRLLVAKVEGAIVGSLTLALFWIPTGLRAWIEDVVVDESVRGQGIGAALNQEALKLDRDQRSRTVVLTSLPSREAANRLYQRLGFKQRETNVYRYSFDS